MPDTSRAPEPAVADSTGNWVDTRAPEGWRPYLRLSRFDRPIGTWLLLLPCWWAILLAALYTDSFTGFDVWLFIGSAIGAALMRGAGCTWNDITDRHIDGSVARTRSRPIPSGQVSVKQALIWMAAQCLFSLAILLTFPPVAILVGMISLVPVAIYPFAKRFTWWPQVFLGLAFNWGALLLWTAHAGALQWPAVALYVAGIAWTLFYDTIYAHQDVEDDALIGVKSTARLFAEATPRWLQGFLTATLVFGGLATLGAAADRGILSLIVAIGGFWALGWHLTWQLARFDSHDNARLLMLFRSNRDAGLLPLPFFAAALLL